ncbi:hypothetical protein GCM10009743_35930 [Kribbella swartbergensis]
MGSDAFDEFLGVLVGALDDAGVNGGELARRVDLSRFHPGSVGGGRGWGATRSTATAGAAGAGGVPVAHNNYSTSHPTPPPRQPVTTCSHSRAARAHQRAARAQKGWVGLPA